MRDRPLRLYLAGPMRGYALYNFPAFYLAQSNLLAVGYSVVSPAEMDHIVGFNEYRDTPDLAFLADALRRDFKAIEVCDGIALLPGWRKSQGTRKEIEYARSLGIACMEVETWVKLSFKKPNASATARGEATTATPPTTGPAPRPCGAAFSACP